MLASASVRCVTQSSAFLDTGCDLPLLVRENGVRIGLSVTQKKTQRK